MNDQLKDNISLKPGPEIRLPEHRSARRHPGEMSQTPNIYQSETHIKINLNCAGNLTKSESISYRSGYLIITEK